jgi:hypothetical protein
MAKKKYPKPSTIPHKYESIATRARETETPGGDDGHAALDVFAPTEGRTTEDILATLTLYLATIEKIAAYARTHPGPDWYEDFILEGNSSWVHDPRGLEDSLGINLPLLTRSSPAPGAHRRLYEFTAEGFGRCQELPPSEGPALRGALGIASVREGCIIWLQRMVMGIVPEARLPLTTVASELTVELYEPFVSTVMHILLTFLATEAYYGLA